ncbi:hypothetical protein KNHN1_52310 [Pseudomonas guariconensis]
MLAGERPGQLGLRQSLAQGSRSGGVIKQALHRLACAQQLPLPFGQLSVIAKAAATVQQEGCKDGNQTGENAVERPRA